MIRCFILLRLVEFS